MSDVGQFHQHAELLIHSKQAEALVKGRKIQGEADNTNHHTIFGLLIYGRILEHIWKRAQGDDPYAEMMLIETERRLENTQQLLNKLHMTIDEALRTEHIPGISLTPCESVKPSKLTLNFSTPHANLGARLIGLYDLLVRKIESCRRMAVLNEKERNRYLYKSRKAIRGVFAAPIKYRDLHITRDDLTQKTSKGQKALATLGPLPDDILFGKIRSALGPIAIKSTHPSHRA